MQDRPTAVELLEALAAFLREEVAPRVDGGLRFKAIVGANVAGIVAREIALGPANDRRELERLESLLGELPVAAQDDASVAERVRELSRQLCRRIEAGEADEGAWREQLLAHLRATVGDKLAIDNPKAKERPAR
jgi:GAF domain-containing protein